MEVIFKGFLDIVGNMFHIPITGILFGLLGFSIGVILLPFVLVVASIHLFQIGHSVWGIVVMVISLFLFWLFYWWIIKDFLFPSKEDKKIYSDVKNAVKEIEKENKKLSRSWIQSSTA